MKQYIKVLLSITVMGVFWIMASASIFKDPADTKKAIDCKFLKPAESKSQEIVIKVFDNETKQPIFDAHVDGHFNKYAKVKEDTICKTKYHHSDQTFNYTDVKGETKIQLKDEYLSSEDYFIFSIKFGKSGYISQSKDDQLSYKDKSKEYKIYLLAKNDQP